MNPIENGSGLFGPPTRMILLGWYDGPTDGVIQFGGPGGPVYRFIMPDEETQLCRPWDAPREYTFAPLPQDALDRLEAALARHLTVKRPVWYVNWQFSTPEAERDADARVAAILAEARPAEWVVTAPPDWSFEEFHPVRVDAARPA